MGGYIEHIVNIRAAANVIQFSQQKKKQPETPFFFIYLISSAQSLSIQVFLLLHIYFHFFMDFSCLYGQETGGKELRDTHLLIVSRFG